MRHLLGNKIREIFKYSIREAIAYSSTHEYKCFNTKAKAFIKKALTQRMDEIKNTPTPKDIHCNDTKMIRAYLKKSK